jgi:ribosomal protein S25
MESSQTDGASKQAESKRRCFVVSAFGRTPEAQKMHGQVLRHLVKKVLDSRYTVVRADQIDAEGLITNQIIEHLLEDDLVVADLTGLNPNVFYEVAVRHAARKPIVHLITKGEEIPFDVANVRAVPYALDDPDLLEEACQDLARKVEAIEEAGWQAALNPISAARDVWLLRNSEQPGVRQTGDLLAALTDLRDEVRTLSRRVDDSERAVVTLLPEEILREVRTLVSGPRSLTAEQIAERLGISARESNRALRVLKSDGHAYLRSDGTWSDIPF